MASASPYVPATGGAYKANRILAEGLAARGHSVQALVLARTAIDRSATADDFVRELARRGITPAIDGCIYRFALAGVAVEAIDGALAIVDRVSALIRDTRPDLVVVSSEDWRQLVLRTALNHAERVVYLAHTSTALPVGPLSAEPHPDGRALLARTAAIVTPSRWLATYLAEQVPGARIAACYLPVFGAPPFPHHAAGERGFVTLVNPCAVKGISIFAGLARARPDLRFAAVPTWGTTAEDRALLAELPNVQLLAASEQIDDIFAVTRVLLVPSLWHETFGLLPVEAMLRGIPVIASAHGGLGEAMLGLDFAIPVTPITRFRRRAVMPTAEDVPPQDLAPWLDALAALDDPQRHAELGARARAAAHAFVTQLSLDEIERTFEACL